MPQAFEDAAKFAMAETSLLERDEGDAPASSPPRPAARPEPAYTEYVRVCARARAAECVSVWVGGCARSRAR